VSASAAHEGDERTPPSETVAGFLAAFSIFASVISLAWHPLRLSLPAILLAMIAAAMGGERRRRLTFAAVMIATVCFFLGMTISVVAQRPLW
jgi:hypothetical protein